MLKLGAVDPISIGGRRAVYIHPNDPGRCVKVLLPNRQPGMLRQAAAGLSRLHRSRYYDENYQDQRIYDHLRQRHGDSIHSHLPVVYGWSETDIGAGLEFELIRDFDGRVSLSGKEHIIVNGLRDSTLGALQELESFLVSLRIQFRDPFPHNVCIQRQADGSERMYIVDGLARKMLLPFSLLPAAITGPRIQKKIARLRKGMQRTLDNCRSGIAPKPKGLLRRRC